MAWRLEINAICLGRLAACVAQVVAGHADAKSALAREIDRDRQNELFLSIQAFRNSLSQPDIARSSAHENGLHFVANCTREVFGGCATQFAGTPHTRGQSCRR